MESYTIESNKKKSRLPARLDFLQSGTGLVLGLFMWAHMVLVASIILGPGAFNWVAKTMELFFLSGTGEGYPIAVFFAVSIVFTLFILHAFLGIRKFPISWKQHRIMRDQMILMKHQDTNLWYIQALTGFIMFFAGSAHLYVMLTHPGSIDPYLSASRVVSDNMWFVYLILLVSVELHGTIGLYRLCMKWGWFQGEDYKTARENRAKLKQFKNKLTIGFLCVGVLALLIFVIIGLRHPEGEPYPASHAVSSHEAAAPVEEEAAEPAEPAAHEEAVVVEESHEQAAAVVEEAEKTESHDSEPAAVAPEASEEPAAGHGDTEHEAVQEEAAHPESGDQGHGEEALHTDGGHGAKEIL